jgi:hypothetical protein
VAKPSASVVAALISAPPTLSDNETETAARLLSPVVNVPVPSRSMYALTVTEP